MRRIREHLTYANVMATIAVFLVVAGGTAMGATYIVSSNSQIGPNTVSGHKPPTGKHANIIGGSITGTDLANSAVGNSKIASGAVTNPKLGTDAVTSAKVADGSLTASDVDTSSIQQRISGSCPAGSAISQVAQSGTATCVSSITDSTNASHATSADSATNADNATNAAALGGQGQASFGSGILGGAVAAPFQHGITSFYPIGFTNGGGGGDLIMPVNATVRDIHVSLTDPAFSTIGVSFQNVSTGAARTCTINGGDTTCDSFSESGGNFGSFSAGQEFRTILVDSNGDLETGFLSFSYRLTN